MLWVLILVVMEYFRKFDRVFVYSYEIGLNPCCNGILSKVGYALGVPCTYRS